MIKSLLIFLAATIGGLSENHVIITNHTGLSIARIEVDGLRLEGHPMTTNSGTESESILITITPKVHDMKVTFRGGANIKWPHFDFRGVHEIVFERNAQHKIDAQVQ